ncbi:MAG: hypothetical protein WCS77_02100 [Elusimicrobiaceae bacterium]
MGYKVEVISSSGDVTVVRRPDPPDRELKPEYIKTLTINEAQKNALRKYSPDFKVWTMANYSKGIEHYPFSKNELPYIIKGDFTGEGKESFVVAGHTKDRNVIVAIIPRGSGYYALPVQEVYKAEQPDYIRLVRRGLGLKICYEENCDKLVMPHDGIAAFSNSFNKNLYWDFFITNAERIYVYEKEFKYLHNVSPGLLPPSELKSEYFDELKLPRALEKIVTVHNKNFKMWGLEDYSAEELKNYHYSAKSLPFIVKGDFNDDGIDDVVVAGHDNDRNIVLALLSSPTGYMVQDVSYPCSNWICPGEMCYLESGKKGKQLPYKPSAIVEIYEKGLQYDADDVFRITLDSGSFGIKAIRHCSEIVADSVEMGIQHIEYGDWRANDPAKDYIYYGYRKEFKAFGGNSIELIDSNQEHASDQTSDEVPFYNMPDYAPAQIPDNTTDQTEGQNKSPGIPGGEIIIETY